jgi:hypothetical protein
MIGTESGLIRVQIKRNLATYQKKMVLGPKNKKNPEVAFRVLSCRARAEADQS